MGDSKAPATGEEIIDLAQRAAWRYGRRLHRGARRGDGWEEAASVATEAVFSASLRWNPDGPKPWLGYALKAAMHALMEAGRKLYAVHPTRHGKGKGDTDVMVLPAHELTWRGTMDDGRRLGIPETTWSTGAGIWGGGTDAPDAALYRTADAEDLECALAALPPEQRGAFSMHWVSGYPMARVAIEMAVSRTTATRWRIAGSTALSTRFGPVFALFGRDDDENEEK